MADLGLVRQLPHRRKRRGNSSAYNVFADTTFAGVIESNDNIFWYSTGQPPVRIGNTVYRSLAAWASATGNDTRSAAEDPRFVDAANHDFHLTQRSPAIDCANTGVAGWSAADREGRAPADDPRIPNSGLGDVTYADRGAFEFVPSTLAADEPAAATLGNAAMMLVSPNPMRSRCRVDFAIAKAGHVRLSVVDVQGRSVATLADDDHSPGRHTAAWDGRSGSRAVDAGVYFVRLETASGVSTRRFALVK